MGGFGASDPPTRQVVLGAPQICVASDYLSEKLVEKESEKEKEREEQIEQAPRAPTGGRWL